MNRPASSTATLDRTDLLRAAHTAEPATAVRRQLYPPTRSSNGPAPATHQPVPTDPPAWTLCLPILVRLVRRPKTQYDRFANAPAAAGPISASAESLRRFRSASVASEPVTTPMKPAAMPASPRSMALPARTTASQPPTPTASAASSLRSVRTADATAPPSPANITRRVTFSLRPKERHAKGSAVVPGPEAKVSHDLSRRGLELVTEDLWSGVDPDTVVAVDLSQNRLTELPESIEQFSNLKRLSLARNQLASLPACLELLHESLAWLDLTSNPIQGDTEQLPSLVVLAVLRKLTGLGLSECGLTSLPKAVLSLHRLVQLALFNNRLQDVPPAIGQLRRLVKLDLSSNRIRSLPSEIGSLRSLEWLNLSQNELTKLPPDICGLKRLRELGLGGNQLSSLPDLSPLQALRILTLYSNQLVSLDPSILTLVYLEKLDLSRNRLTALPPSLFLLPHLAYLNVRANQLTSLPSRFRYTRSASSPTPRIASSLRALDVCENQLTAIPAAFAALNWRHLALYSNPWHVPPVVGAPIVQSVPRTAPRLRTLAVNGILRSQPLFLVPDCLSAATVGLPDRVVAYFKEPRRCDACGGAFTTDEDLARVDGWADSVPVVGDDKEVVRGDGGGDDEEGAAHETPFETVVFLRVLDNRDVPCRFAFCSAACRSEWPGLPAGV
ncbi:hypothetical protein GGF31_000873 [Allomyces arbusculus]|nr:hypothetical protein GGF31_000873 [Allomyces arbusculus]